jgi:hypothetical protein
MWKMDFNTASSRGTPVSDMKTKCYCEEGRFVRWEDVRFNIERDEKMVIVDIKAFEYACHSRKRYHISADSCVVGVLSEDRRSPAQNTFILGDDFNVKMVPKDQVIIIYRMPNGRTDRGSIRTNTYLPQAHLHALHEQEIATDMEEFKYKLSCTHDEIERLQIMQDMVGLQVGRRKNEPITKRRPGHRRTFRRANVHPSRAVARERYAGYINGEMKRIAWGDIPKAVPKPDYLCYCCFNYFEPLHYINDCPGQKRAKWVPMKSRKAPHGIPKLELLQVPWESPIEEIETAPWIDAQGQLWKKKR